MAEALPQERLERALDLLGEEIVALVARAQPIEIRTWQVGHASPPVDAQAAIDEAVLIAERLIADEEIEVVRGWFVLHQQLLGDRPPATVIWTDPVRVRMAAWRFLEGACDGCVE